MTEGRTAGEGDGGAGAREASGSGAGAGGSEAGAGAADQPAGRVGRIRVAPGVAIDPRELTWRFSTSGGAGGQHVNTSNTRAEVTFHVADSTTLPGWARQRLLERLGPTVTVSAGDRRSQARNRGLAVERLVERLGSALETPVQRRPTRPTKASQRRRVDLKRRRGEVKRDRRQGRGAPTGDE
jgi:ribosome-associated protein